MSSVVYNSRVICELSHEDEFYFLIHLESLQIRRGKKEKKKERKKVGHPYLQIAITLIIILAIKGVN